MGNTPLHWSIVTFKKNLTILFIQHALTYQKNVINRANKPAKVDYGSNSPLIMALKAASQYFSYNKFDIEVAELLVAAGADVNSIDNFKQSAFHWAAILRCPMKFFNLLLDNQAQFKPNIYGKTPKDLYETEIDKQMLRINRAPTSFTELGFHITDWNQDHEKREWDLERAVGNRNSKNDQETIQLLAILQDSLISEIKLDIATINRQDHMGRTLLHQAIFDGKFDEFQKLLNAGSDITIKDKSDLTALELAQKLQQKFTYKVNPKFFNSIETSIKATNCKIWKECEEILLKQTQLNALI